MDRINLYISEKQLTYLKKLSDISLSEHIRKAIGEYIERLESNKVSSSPSKYAKSNN
jgi:GMP synthase PP-ATPase subunit